MIKAQYCRVCKYKLGFYTDKCSKCDNGCKFECEYGTVCKKIQCDETDSVKEE